MNWKLAHGIAIFLGALALLVANSFSLFIVDWISIALLILLTIIPYAGAIKKITYGDTVVDLEQTVEQFSHDVAKLKKDDKQSKEYEESQTLIETLEKKDPELACVKLRIMFEMVVRDVYERATKNNKYLPVNHMLEVLYTKKILDRALLDYSREFMYYANRLVHGQSVPDDMYADLIDAGLVLLDAFYDIIDEVETKKK